MAASRAQCEAHLGIVHIGETGSAEPDYDTSYRSRHDRYRSYEDDRYEDDDEDPDFTVESVDDSWQYVDEWRDPGDRVVEFGRIPLEDGELLPAGALDGEAPDRKRMTEASGNEGATYERSYHRAALVLWRQDRSVDVLLQAGVRAALPYLERFTASGECAPPEAIAAAEWILEEWPVASRPRRTCSTGDPWPGPADRIRMIGALAKLNQPQLLERFIGDVVTASYVGSENAALLASIEVLGDAKSAAVLSALVSAGMPRYPGECAALVLALSGTPSHRFPDVAGAAVEGLDRIGAGDSEMLGPRFLENLLRALQPFSGGALCSTAAEKIVSRPEIFHPVTVVVPAIGQICAGRQQETWPDAAIRLLWTGAAEFLLERGETPPEAPTDWRLDVELKCRCADCVELQAFARDGAARVHRFRVRKERRSHLHRTIDSHRLDMTHVTERVGSPQTLVCAKDRRTFERRMKGYRDEIAAMRTLVSLAYSRNCDSVRKDAGCM